MYVLKEPTGMATNAQDAPQVNTGVNRQCLAHVPKANTGQVNSVFRAPATEYGTP